MKKTTTAVLVLLATGLLAAGQDAAPPPPDQIPAAPPPAPTFAAAGQGIERQLEECVRELAALRESIAAEKIPLAKTLADLETRLVEVRQELSRTGRTLDDRTRGQAELRSDIKARTEQVGYLASLLGEFRRNWESGLHIAELQRYRAPLEAARLVSEDDAKTDREILAAESVVLAASLDRLEEIAGGTRFEGKAVDADGTVSDGTFVLVGPVAIFRSKEGTRSGMAVQRLGSLEAGLAPFTDPPVAEAAAGFVTGLGTTFPFDPSLGDAQKIAETQETWAEHVAKGGPIMWPIFGLAGLALLVALGKWIGFLFVRSPSNRTLKRLLEAMAKGDRAGAEAIAMKMPGPAGKMLRDGVGHLGEPRELIEEVMYETVLKAKLRLNRFIPFVGICAAAAPLLGLLGTVTGIMNTFKLITVFGTGDVRTLSSGISEALITTEYGLIVAIPALLLHAFLARKAKSILDRMETFGIAFMNQVSRMPAAAPAPAAPAPAPEPPSPPSAPNPPAPEPTPA
jgi:biopolymer transport protein ExbB